MIDAGWYFLLTLTTGIVVYLLTLFVLDYRAMRAFWQPIRKRVKP